ncbi:MAG: hypothetical protein LBG80_08125 [Bacteroidales bacterium]|jgi:sterol desaturase/sphingolipid hydroxylase (fatty acid hydroxylase superfamily)|nr:hypothetical protein [Bacteroidales bacterium]
MEWIKNHWELLLGLSGISLVTVIQLITWLIRQFKKREKYEYQHTKRRKEEKKPFKDTMLYGFIRVLIGFIVGGTSFYLFGSVVAKQIFGFNIFTHSNPTFWVIAYMFIAFIISMLLSFLSFIIEEIDEYF